MKKMKLILVTTVFFFINILGQNNEYNGWVKVTYLDTLKRPVTDLNFFCTDTGFVLSYLSNEYGATFNGMGFTLNAGKLWETFLVNSIDADCFDFNDRNESILIAGTFILHTYDSWNTWEKVYVDSGIYEADLNEIAFGNKNRIYAAGLQMIMRSTDGGYNWEYIQPEFTRWARFSGLCAVDSLTVYAVNQDQLLKTTDGGETWEEKYSAIYQPRLEDVKFVDKDVGWIVGEFRNIFKTLDGGDSWIDQSQNDGTTGDAFTAIDALDEKTAVTVSSEGAIFWTSDGGKTWEEQVPNGTFGPRLLNVQILNDSVAYAVGDSGVILRTTTGGVTAVREENEIVPMEFSLEQNYPNPFSKGSGRNLETTIKYTIPFGGANSTYSTRVVLKVYDILGKEISTLVNKRQSAGNYSVTLDGKDLPSGVYLYSLQYGGKRITKKMVLLR